MYLFKYIMTTKFTPKDVYDIVKKDGDINELIKALNEEENKKIWYTGNRSIEGR